MAVLNRDELLQIPAEVRVLELGCGQKKLVPHSIAVDMSSRTRADVIHDLNRTPYPFDDDSFDLVIAEHVLEHLDDVVKVVEEVYRLCRPGARFLVEVPHFSNHNFFTDPTHRHAFGARTFDYFVPGTELYDFKYSTAAFKKRRVYLSGYNRYIERWINSHQELYERRFAFLYPGNHVNYELEALKPSGENRG